MCYATFSEHSRAKKTRYMMNSKFSVDAHFYTHNGPYNLSEVAGVMNGIAAKSDHVPSGVAPLKPPGRAARA
jgi:hypothetical protein